MSRCVKYGLLPLLTIAAFSCCKGPVETINWSDNLPATYGVKSDHTNSGLQPWKVFYKDSVLLELLGTAVQNSFDNRIAGEKANISHSAYAVAKSNFLPLINASANARVDRFGDYTMNGIGNHDTNRSETLPINQRLPNPYPEYFTGITFSWEANLWNKLGSRRKSAEAKFMVSHEMKHAVVSWVVGEVAGKYYELLGLDQEKKVLIENLSLQKVAIEVAKIQKEGGKVNQLAVDQFESQYLNTHNRLFRVGQKILETEARINQLSGKFPKSLSRDSIQGYDSTFEVHFGSPRDLIALRPDIRQAEMMVVASHADLVSARAAFYPSLQISGTAGFSAFDFSKLFFTPASAIYGLGAGLTAPIIQQKKIKALYNVANAKQRMALLTYHQSILDGYHEVYRILNDSYTLKKQVTLKKQEVQVLKRATRNAKDLFNVGFATYLEVITTQKRLLEVEMELADLNKNLLLNRVLFYRALGGGWTEF